MHRGSEAIASESSGRGCANCHQYFFRCAPVHGRLARLIALRLHTLAYDRHQIGPLLCKNERLLTEGKHVAMERQGWLRVYFLASDEREDP